MPQLRPTARVIACLACACLAGAADAALLQIGSSVGLSAAISSMQFPTVASSTSVGPSVDYVNPDNTLSFTATNGDLYNETVGTTYFGSAFASGTNLLFAGSPANGPAGPLTIRFNTAVVEFGFGAENYVFGDYTVSFDIFDGATLLGSLLASGNASAQFSFVGARVDAGEHISRVVLRSAPADLGALADDFGIGPVSYGFGATLALPEPASLALASLAMLALALTRVRRR